MAESQPVSPLKAWLMAARPKTLPAAVGPVLVGVGLAYADGAFRLLPALACVVAALLLQIGSNMANDYFDFFHGADSHDRLGPARVTASGLIHPREMRRGMLVVFGLAALVGLYLVYVGGWLILVVGAAAIAAALAYTGGPFPFGYYGLGDLFVFLFFGLAAVCGTYWVQALALTPTAVWAAVPMGALITNILVVNNLRDIETDRRAGKHTLAVRLGRQGTRVEYLLLLVLSYLVPVGLWGWGGRPLWVLLPLLSLPLAVTQVRAVFAMSGRGLNPVLAGTARLSLVFGALFALGLAMT